MTKEQIRELALTATTLAEIQTARQLLRDWRRDHPEDSPMYDLFEQLYMMEDAAHTIAAEEADRKQTLTS